MMHRFDAAFNRILDSLNAIKQGEINMDADIQKLIDQAKLNTNAEASAVATINGLAAKLSAALANVGGLSPADRATLQAEVTDMQTGAASLGAAIVANTPAAGNPPVTTPPVVPPAV